MEYLRVLVLVRLNKYSVYMNKTLVQTDNTEDVEIANRILNALIVTGTSLTSLSEASGIRAHTIRRSLHQQRADRRSLTFREFRKIAEALGVQPSDLLPATFTGNAA
jgi:lambda repressor-like predicted transcriptional regulator